MRVRWELRADEALASRKLFDRRDTVGLIA